MKIIDKEQLCDWFKGGSKTKKKWKIGTEHEKFAYEVDPNNQEYKPLKYLGKKGIQFFLSEISKHGWNETKENNNIIGLYKEGQSITLEPGGQIELSGAPLENIHQTCLEVNKHLDLVKSIGKKLDIKLVGIGARPNEKLSDISWMPKERYNIMRNYMPKVGELGLHMMSSTCTVQANLDYSSEVDMIRKFRLGLSLQPIITALFANSPFTEGKPNGYLSWRSHIWSKTDPDRCGLLPFVFEEDFSFMRYVDFALEVPMYFIKRKNKYINCAGMSFKEFMSGKLESIPGELPIISDWESHLTTIFTEVRLKQYIEMRGADAGPWNRICALPAFWVGLLYDDDALRGAESICSKWTNQDREYIYKEVPINGLNLKIGGHNLLDIARELVKLSRAGLEKRQFLDGAGNDEGGYLQPLEDIIRENKLPSEKLLHFFYGKWNQKIKKVYSELSY